jgi:hypothetical protein
MPISCIFAVAMMLYGCEVRIEFCRCVLQIFKAPAFPALEFIWRCTSCSAKVILLPIVKYSFLQLYKLRMAIVALPVLSFYIIRQFCTFSVFDNSTIQRSAIALLLFGTLSIPFTFIVAVRFLVFYFAQT